MEVDTDVTYRTILYHLIDKLIEKASLYQPRQIEMWMLLRSFIADYIESSNSVKTISQLLNALLNEDFKHPDPITRLRLSKYTQLFISNLLLLTDENTKGIDMEEWIARIYGMKAFNKLPKEEQASVR